MSFIDDLINKAVGVARELPLDTRTKATEVATSLIPKSILASYTGVENVEGAKALARFLGRSGDPMNIDIPDERWQKFITLANKKGWTTSTNPKKKGWEWSQIGTQLHSPKVSPLWNLLGAMTTVRRRPSQIGGYEYELAEDFDLQRGEGRFYGSTNSRLLPNKGYRLLKQLFPELLTIKGGVNRIGLKSENESWYAKSNGGTFNSFDIGTYGKSFPMISTYRENP